VWTLRVTKPASNCPSPALREREGPSAKRWEGEGTPKANLVGNRPLTRRALDARATLCRDAGEGRKQALSKTPLRLSGH
jgi:hypothetical protein